MCPKLIRLLRCGLVSLLLVGFLMGTTFRSVAQSSGADSTRWLKGNLHTHSLWSDGDDYPEMIVDWYKSHGYQFLGLSDHNVLLAGQKWTDAGTNRGGGEALENYIKRFGANWVDQRREGDKTKVRLKTLAEFRGTFEEPERFLLIPSEEITDHHLTFPVHMNVSNLRDLIPPQHGSNVTDIIQNNVNAVMKQRKETGQPMIPHLNHPNFGWGVTAEDMVSVKGERFFEIYNGHPSVHNNGDKQRAGTERIWDILLTRRLAELGLDPVWGTGVDDAHAYRTFDSTKSNPGRGWIMVRAAKLDPATIISAMEAGDFYASSGVRLKDVQRGKKKLSLEIEPEDGVTYVTQFIGTRKGYDPRSEAVKTPSPTTRHYSDDIGALFLEVKGTTASYELKGDEIYVRAKVISSKLKTNPYAKGEFETAWIQPLVTGMK